MKCTRKSGSDWLTTGEAAQICSVTADAVQKWIRKGRLAAQKTAGGHYRIARRDIEPFATANSHARWFSAPPGTCRPQPLRCWEYLSGNGAIHEDCLKCVVYRVRASWCFAVLGRNEGAEHARHFCRSQISCQECAYYQQVCSVPARVLVIGPTEAMRLMLGEAPPSLTLEFGGSGYEASALISTFRPLFAVVDESLLGSHGGNLLDNLAQETRVPGLRVLLAVSTTDTLPPAVTQFIDGFLVKPFTASGLAAFLATLPIERVAQGG